MRVRKTNRDRPHIREIHDIALSAARLRRRAVMPESEIRRLKGVSAPFRRDRRRRDPAGVIRLDQFDAQAPHVRIALHGKTHQIMPFRKHAHARRGVRRPSHQRIQLVMKAVEAFNRHLRLDVLLAHGKMPCVLRRQLQRLAWRLRAILKPFFPCKPFVSNFIDWLPERTRPQQQHALFGRQIVVDGHSGGRRNVHRLRNHHQIGLKQILLLAERIRIQFHDRVFSRFQRLRQHIRRLSVAPIHGDLLRLQVAACRQKRQRQHRLPHVRLL